MKKIILLLSLILISFTSNAQCYSVIDAGVDFTIGIKTDNTLFAWGRNNFGQLGDGTSVNKSVPTQIGNDNHWTKISIGETHILAIKTDGTLWAWGGNAFGKLGDGTTVNKNTPTQIGTDSNWNLISAGISHSVAIKTDGTLWAWGRNYSGQLGDGTTVNKIVPTQIGTATDWKSIAAGNEYTLARRIGSSLWVWGDNGSGQLGDGTTIDKHTPIEIGVGSNNWMRIYVGSSTSMAIKTDGTLWSWGNGGYGTLGNGSGANVLIPTQVGTATWTSISMGFAHVIGKKTDATLWSWGLNSDGQLGDGTTTNKFSPIYLATTNVGLIAAGYYHSVVTTTNGTGAIYTFGDNQYGQIGNGTTDLTGAPVAPTAINCPASLANESFDANIISLYPNPSNGIFTINSIEKLKQVIAFDVLGKEIEVNSISNNQFSINTKGIYFLKIISDNAKITNKKIIIE